MSLVTQLEKRLPAWLKHQGDRKAMLATKPEIDAYVKTLAIVPADQPTIAKNIVEDQKVKSDVLTFAGADRAVISITGQGVGVSLFNAKNRCAMGFIRSADGNRYVLTDGPLVDDRTFESSMDGASETTTKTPLEKKDGKWAVVEVKRAAIPPPDCTTILKNAAKAVYVAEMAFYAEQDRYEESLEKIGIDSTSVSGATVKIKVEGSGEKAHFTAELTRAGGVAKIDDKSSGQAVIVTACTN
ncbi:MAG: hypothetical protein QM817_11770 [Archangium sp.]